MNKKEELIDKIETAFREYCSGGKRCVYCKYFNKRCSLGCRAYFAIDYLIDHGYDFS